MRTAPQLLIVDDEPSARQTMEMLLLKEAYDLHFATNGPEALDLLETVEADVILLDVMMPGMDGFEVCRRLKQHPTWQHIPIILVTALDTKQDLATGLDSGADDFLHKPFNGLELRARVRSMLRIKQRHDELEAALRLREDLSNMIVHDIRSPLSSIMIYCDLAEAFLPDNIPNHVATIRNETERLNAFLTDMLMMAKMEHGRIMLTRTSENMVKLLKESAKSYEAMAKFKRINFELNIPETAYYAHIDVNLWRRVFDNLLSNALKFSPSGGHVLVRVNIENADMQGDFVTDEKRICIHIIDEGPGIPPEHLETIFDKFKIVSSGRRDIAQVGLGLAFCKMVVDAHHGQIFVKPNTPRGSIFTVQLA
ncbi:MAG: response regulator [Chloroflexota bacterium]